MLKYLFIGMIGYGAAAYHYGNAGCRMQAFNSQDEQGVMMGHAYNAERTKAVANIPGLLSNEEFVDQLLLPKPGTMQPTGQPVPLKK